LQGLAAAAQLQQTGLRLHNIQQLQPTLAQPPTQQWVVQGGPLPASGQVQVGLQGSSAAAEAYKPDGLEGLGGDVACRGAGEDGTGGGGQGLDAEGDDAGGMMMGSWGGASGPAR